MSAESLKVTEELLKLLVAKGKLNCTETEMRDIILELRSKFA
jgi:hypothetical protein